MGTHALGIAKTTLRWALGALTLGSVTALTVLAVGPHTGRYQAFTVLTASMDPGIPAGSVVLARPVAPGTLEVGDVITYSIPVDDRRVVTHRVEEILEEGATPTVRTKGDANEESDSWTTKFSTGPVWKVFADVPHVGAGLRALQGRGLRKVNLILMPVLFAVSLLARIWRPTPQGGGPEDAGGERRPDAAPVTTGHLDVAPATAR